MERQRRSFTEEYKRQAVELVVSSRRSITSGAKELGLRDSVLRRWVDKLRRTRLRRSPGCARRTNGCAWSATF
jgi:transposase-like protein